MNRDQARALIAQTFTQAFDKGRFHTFIINLVNRIDETKAQSWNGQYIKDAFKDHVHRYERLGIYTSPDNEKLDVLVVHLTKESKLERGRTAIRNFVADHLKTRDEKDAALVAFVSPTEKQWRFSYVKMEYSAVQKASGKVGVETRLTPARRFSYLVGEGESCHTAQTRFLGLLQDTASDPKLSDIEEAFSVEAVTADFFKKYAQLFGDFHKALVKLVERDSHVRDEFKTKGVNIADFAKKLMGQIVFLYFLQKKGWLGVPKGRDWGTGPQDFLRRLAKGDYGPYANFFNEILEPLFYNTLATDRGHDAWCSQFKCRIPFLNGGLFEPISDYEWREVDIRLPDRLFTNTERVEEGVVGTGVLDVFDRYNFTVNEAEPLEKEVAIDPEMLGKVFENLIEENLRKGLGAYYTPRDIVHYMCQESLINYLDTALNQEKEIIPHCEIDTFVRLGEQISHYEAVEAKYAVKMPRSIEKNARQLDEKLADIAVCDPAVGSGAFPVGMMTEIVRARSALTPYFNDVHERTPYHFKRHAIQSCLYGVDIDAGAVEIAKLRLWLSLVVDEEDVKQVKPLPNLDYKIVVGNSLLRVEKTLFNEGLFQKLEALKPKYFDETDTRKKAILKRQIDDLIHKLTNGKEIFDFEIYFSEVFHSSGGFGVVIANPPYVSHDQIADNKRTLQHLFKAYSPFADIYCYFLERALQLMHAGGTLSFITSNSYLKAEYGANLRSLLYKNAAVRQLLNLEGSQVFSDAIVNVAILVAEKGQTPKTGSTLVSNSAWNSGSFREYVQGQAFQIPLSHFASKQWSLASPEILTVQTKIEKSGPTLEQLGAKIRLGVATGYNEAFVIDPANREKLISAERASAEIIVPVVRGRDIERYGHLKPKVFLIAAKNGVNVRRDYRAIYEHLRSFGKTFQTRGAQGENWWNLRACAFYDDFELDKIAWIELTEKARFTVCQSGIWCLNSAYFMLPPRGYSTNYLLGILNSRVVNFYFRLIAQTSGMGVPRWINLYVAQFPIPNADSGARKELESWVERILSAKKRDADANTTAWEGEIDRLVYQLYKLTPAEIKLVEKTSGSDRPRASARIP
jgi:type I restriction-modification system DNA methylase subunit